MNGYTLVRGLPACKGHANRLLFNARDVIPGKRWMQGMRFRQKEEQLPDGYITSAGDGECVLCASAGSPGTKVSNFFYVSEPGTPRVHYGEGSFG